MDETFVEEKEAGASDDEEAGYAAQGQVGKHGNKNSFLKLGVLYCSLTLSFKRS